MPNNKIQVSDLCPKCGKSFYYKYGLKRHLKTVHKKKAKTVDGKILPNGEESISKLCPKCGKSFKYTHTFRRHMREIHNRKKTESNGKAGGNLKCPIEGCEENLRSRTGKEHLALSHDICVEEEELEVSSFQEFIKWKKNIEEKTDSRYVSKTGPKLNKSLRKKKYSYICHRTGLYISHGTGIKTGKLQGSCKTGLYCPATIEALESEDGRVEIWFLKTHCGHSTDLGHIPLSANERSYVAGKLKKGVSADKLLAYIRKNNSNTRLGLITRKDINNIRRSVSVGLVTSSKVDDVLNSLDKWVSKVSTCDETSPVKFYHKNGSNKTYSNVQLPRENTLLSLMTSKQEEVLKNCTGSVKVCLDHVVVLSGLHVLALFIYDDQYNDGFPAAFCITSRTDKSSIVLFLTTVKDRIGELRCKVVLTPTQTLYYDAWKEVFGEVENHFHSPWSVMKNWRSQIKIRVSGARLVMKRDIGKDLKSILNEPDAENVVPRFSAYIERLAESTDTKSLAKYLEPYTATVESWADAFRQSVNPSITSGFEDLRQRLRDVILAKKEIDGIMAALFWIVQSTMVENGILSEGINGNEIGRQHEATSQISLHHIKTVENGRIWKVESSDGNHAVVSLEKSKCAMSCRSVCWICEICIHMISCTCVTSLFGCPVCKHIHAVCIFHSVTFLEAAETENIQKKPRVRRKNTKEESCSIDSGDMKMDDGMAISDDETVDQESGIMCHEKVDQESGIMCNEQVVNANEGKEQVFVVNDSDVMTKVYMTHSYSKSIVESTSDTKVCEIKDKISRLQAFLDSGNLDLVTLENVSAELDRIIKLYEVI